MKMRDFEELADIQIPPEQEKMMDIICNAWDECQKGDCTNCPDRPKKNMRLISCFCLKYSRRLIEAGYKIGTQEAVDTVPTADVAPAVPGRWIPYIKKYHVTGTMAYTVQNGKCSVCGYETGEGIKTCEIFFKFCFNCGAKMDGEPHE